MKLELIAKILDNLANLSIPKMLMYCFLIAILYLLYVLEEPIRTYGEYLVSSNQQVSSFEPRYELTAEKKERVEKILQHYITRNDNVAMILLYKFVPDQDTFFQGRVVIASAVARNTELRPANDYRLDWLPISALRAESNKILSGHSFSVSVNDITNSYLQNQHNLRDEYLSPINFYSLEHDGAKYLISVPVKADRVVGYVTVYFNVVPTKEEQILFEQYAKTIALDAGYYITF